MNKILLFSSVMVAFIAFTAWMISKANKFAKTQEAEKKVKDKFKGRDLKKYAKEGTFK